MAYDLTLYYFLKQNLKLVYITTSKDETYIRCPFCGDSKRDNKKARFYIKNKPPFKFYCFNCDISGIVTDDVLDFIVENSGLSGASLDNDILKYLKESKKNYNNNLVRFNKKISKIPYFNKTIQPDFSIDKFKGIYTDKLDYLSERFDFKFSRKHLNKFKIVLSIKDFYKNNGLDLTKRIGNNDKVNYVVSQLDRNYVGFLSSDRHVIIFRNINSKDKNERRFNNFRVLNDSDDYDVSKTYNITNNINLYQDKHNVYISEGPLDIIGGYLGLFNGDYDDFTLDDRKKSIFLANGGKSYINSVGFLTSMGLYNNDYTILSDNDIKLDFYKRMRQITPALCDSNINVYYNTEGKDFGTDRNHIEISPRFRV